MSLLNFKKQHLSRPKNNGFLFISYLVTEQRIINVWRVNAGDKGYNTLKEFTSSQIDRINLSTFIPNIRIYQFNYQDMRTVPLLSSDNSHFIPFVSNKEPEVNISILEAMFLVQENIEPIAPITEESPCIASFYNFLNSQEQREDDLRWKQEITKDAQTTDYDQLANLILKYEHHTTVTERQIELLNNENTALRIFQTLREYFDQTDYIQDGWALDDFDYLIHVPVSQRTALHCIRAELFKVIDFEYGLFDDQADKDKKLFELNIFLSGLDVPSTWESSPIPYDWKKTACYCMPNASAAADAIASFQYLPEITEEQLNYLIHTGTVPQTFVQSGIMSEVFTKTPLFKTRYGLFLEHFNNINPTAADNLVIDSLLMMATQTLQHLKSGNPHSPEIGTIQKTISAVETYRQACKEKKAQEVRERNLNQLEQALIQLKTITKETPHGEPILYNGDYFEEPLRSNFMDVELSVLQCNLILDYLPHIPAEVVRKVIPVVKGQEYGRLPEHQDLSVEGIIKAIACYGISPLHKIVLTMERQRLEESIFTTEKEINQLHRQLTQTSERITACEEDLERKKQKKFELKSIINSSNIAV